MAGKKEIKLVPVEEQPYEIPQNWCWVRMSDLYAINPRNSAADDIPASFVPMERIAPGMVSDFTYEVQPWGKAKKGHTQFADGDVAFAKISPCFENRKSMMVNCLENGIGAGTTELIILRQPLVDQAYTFWMVSDDRFIQGGNQTYSGTVGQQRISMEYVRNYPVPLAPLAEQKRIVSTINELFADLDKAAENAQSIVDGYQQRRAAILADAFAGHLTEQWREQNNVSESSWIVTLLKDIVSGFKYGSSEKSDYNNNGTPVLRIPNIGDGEVDFSDLKYLVGEENGEYLVHTDDILIIRSNGSRDLVGKCALVPKLDRKYAYASFLIRIQVLDSIIPRFLMHYINSSEAREQLFKKAKSSAGIHNINSKELGSITISLPSIEEQQEIVRILDDLLGNEQRIKEAAEEMLDKIAMMKKSILADAFRGKLGTNDPADEPATELLKQILS